jgi:type I restriction enzyme M protein
MPRHRASESRARYVARALLHSRGWNIESVPRGGTLFEESEYKSNKRIAECFSGRSKSGPGDAYPDFLLLDNATSGKPVLVVETKPSTAQHDDAKADAVHYAEALRAGGFAVLAAAVSGARQEVCEVSGLRRTTRGWKELTIQGNPIDWIPSPEQVSRLLARTGRVTVEPEVPHPDALARQADLLNEILRDCKITDALRPIYAATFMLGVWYRRVPVAPSKVLVEVNRSASAALKAGGRADLSKSLRLDVENTALANRAWEVVQILQQLNIRSLSREHDYIGQLYETFFRYTGGNTIGQYFTPRHIIAFMCEIVNVRPGDIVFDPACGTGGFLIGALNRMTRETGFLYEESVKHIKDHLFGMESEPATAALCVTNMLLRGDGKTGIRQQDCFTDRAFPNRPVNFVLMNPPFPHRSTDTPTIDFLDRGLEALDTRGLLASIVPYSLLVKTTDWHRQILKRHRLRMVATLPPDLFLPYSQFNTAFIVLEKGVPHGSAKAFFCRIHNDGFKLKKKRRVDAPGSTLPDLLRHYENKTAKVGLCANATITGGTPEWSPEAFVKSPGPSHEDLSAGLDRHIRNHAAFYIRHGNRLRPTGKASATLDSRLFDVKGDKRLVKYGPFKLGDYFEVELGGKDEVEDLDDGPIPMVTTSEYMNGVTAWKDVRDPYPAGTITVATDGSIASSFVQEAPFYAFYKVALLYPKRGVKLPHEALYFISYLITRERWRYVYARKLGKTRLLDTELRVPYRAGKPDFRFMASAVKRCSAWPLIALFAATQEVGVPQRGR